MSTIIYCSIYARYSPGPSQRALSITDQIKACREFAASKGWVVLEEHIYCDQALSGASIAPRDEFTSLMRVSVNPGCPFQKILVESTSRVARNTRDALNVFSLLTFYGVHTCYISQNIDTSDETAEEMVTIQGLVDSLYVKNLARQTHRGIKGQVERGFSGGGRRYGYRTEPIFSGKVDIHGLPEIEGFRFKIFAEEAETILRVYKLFGEEGYSAMRIVNLFNKELIETGSPRPPKGDYWSWQSLLGNRKMGRGILSNPFYNGRYYWNRHRKLRHPETGKARLLIKEKEKWVLCVHDELKIVPDHLWEKVQNKRTLVNEITQGKYTKGKILYSNNFFAGLLKCASCGGNIVIVSGGKYPKYGCSTNWHKGSHVCKMNTRIRKFDLEDAVICALNLRFENDAVNYMTEKVKTLLTEATDRPEWQRGALQDHVNKTEKEIENYVEAIQFGIISETVKDKLLAAETKKAEIVAKLKNMEIEKNTRPCLDLQNERDIQNYIYDLRGTLYKNPPLGKEFFRHIISEVKVQHENNAWLLAVIVTGGIKCSSNEVTTQNICLDVRIAA